MPKALNKIQYLSRNQLKYFAMAGMFLSHAMPLLTDSIPVVSYVALMIVEPITHFCFPIFIALAAEGIVKTKHLTRNIITLMMFGAVSEPLFDLYFYGTFFTLEHENILWLYLAGSLFYLVYSKTQLRGSGGKGKPNIRAISYILLILLAITMAVIAQIIHIDYRAFGMIDIIVACLIYERTKCFPITMGSVVLIQIVAMTTYYNLPLIYTIMFCIGLLIAEALSFLYDPNRICSHNALQKYSGYAFYPVHLAVLCGAKALIGGI